MRIIFVLLANLIKLNDDTIDWKEREKELIDLCNKHRKTDGSYDCIIGGSGGKIVSFNLILLNTSTK